MTNFAEMGKVELRAACKAAGISYGKLNNDGMRAALSADEDARMAIVDAGQADEFNTPARTEVEHPRTYYIEMASKMDLSKLGLDGVEGHCPHCGIHLDNGVATYADICDSSKRAAGEMKNEIECLGCGGEWGEPIRRPAKTADRHSGSGLKIEKQRESRNGVKRPSIGGKCRAVWDALDGLLAELEAGETVTATMVKELAADEGWNVNNASIEFYQWRKFNGIAGRSK